MFGNEKHQMYRFVETNNTVIQVFAHASDRVERG